MRNISSIFIFSVFYFCCSSTHIIKHNQSAYDDLNKSFKGKEVSIILASQDIRMGQNIEVMLDTTHWIEFQIVLKSRIPWREDSTLIHRSISTSEIRGISINNDSKAALFGACAGLIIGASLSYISVQDDQSGQVESFTKPIVGGLAGMLLGFFIGPGIGYTEEYIINVPDSNGEGK